MTDPKLSPCSKCNKPFPENTDTSDYCHCTRAYDSTLQAQRVIALCEALKIAVEALAFCYEIDTGKRGCTRISEHSYEALTSIRERLND